MFTTLLIGVEREPFSGVMSPPWTRRDAEITVDIAACHGSEFVPGVWRDLSLWTEVYESSWWKLRQAAELGVFDAARDAVAHLTTKSLLGTTLAADAAVIRTQMSEDLSTTLSWFPTGITTMIVEVEWLLRELSVESQHS